MTLPQDALKVWVYKNTSAGRNYVQLFLPSTADSFVTSMSSDSMTEPAAAVELVTKSDPTKPGHYELDITVGPPTAAPALSLMPSLASVRGSGTEPWVANGSVHIDYLVIGIIGNIPVYNIPIDKVDAHTSSGIKTYGPGKELHPNITFLSPVDVWVQGRSFRLNLPSSHEAPPTSVAVSDSNGNFLGTIYAYFRQFQYDPSWILYVTATPKSVWG
jgi:hypothetical protein